MADLDADLYGDLYGNDDDGATPAPAQPDTNATGELEDYPDDTTTASASASVPTTMPRMTTQATLLSTQPAHVAQVSQPIQTYVEGDPMPPPRMVAPMVPAPLPAAPLAARPMGAVDTSQIPVGERSVRPSEMKDEGKMFIGGLNWDTTDDGLRTYFEQFGQVDACTIMRDATGRSRCFAFLTFDDAASVNAVMVREHVLDGKIIDPKRAIPRQEHQRATKLFIGGLAGSVTNDSMRAFFSQFGRVVDSTVMLDRETGRSKGFGFVSLEDVDVTPILGFGKLEIDGKVIDVKLAQPRYQRDGEPGAGAPPGAGAGQARAPNAYAGGGVGAGGGAPGTPFDPQALATLYTRMFQINGGMNMGMMGGMPGMMPGMGMPMRGPGPGPQGMNMAGVPRGPRNGMGGGGGPGGPQQQQQGGPMGPNGPGPQRTGRGQHNYHPYAR